MNRFVRSLGAVALACALLAGLCGGSAPAEGSHACGRNLTWEADGDGVLTISGTGDMYSCIEWTPGWNRRYITKAVLEPGVTGIGALAFERQPYLEEVVIPDTVTRIGDFAFMGCASLESITIPDSVTEIGEDPFAGCDALREIVLSPGHPVFRLEDGMLIRREDGRVICRVPAYPDGRCVIPEETVEMPCAFTDAYPGYTGLYRMESGENTAVFLARTPDDVLVLLCGTEREDGWTIVESAPLPADSCAVLYEGHEMLDTGNARCTVRRYHDDTWGLDNVGDIHLAAGPKWIGMAGALDRDFGIHPWGNLETMDWISLDNDWAVLIRHLDLSAYAVPKRENPGERTPVYSSPDAAGEEIAALVNGAPLFVAGQDSEWTRVCLGRDDGTAWKLDGWVRTEYLVFGKAAHEVLNTDPGYFFCADRNGTMTRITPEGEERFPASEFNEDTCLGVGEKADGTGEYWLVYDCDTEKIGFIPKQQLLVPGG